VSAPLVVDVVLVGLMAASYVVDFAAGLLRRRRGR
jgi:hypothetical protein